MTSHSGGDFESDDRDNARTSCSAPPQPSAASQRRRFVRNDPATTNARRRHTPLFRRTNASSSSRDNAFRRADRSGDRPWRAGWPLVELAARRIQIPSPARPACSTSPRCAKLIGQLSADAARIGKISHAPCPARSLTGRGLQRAALRATRSRYSQRLVSTVESAAAAAAQPLHLHAFERDEHFARRRSPDRRWLRRVPGWASIRWLVRTRVREQRLRVIFDRSQQRERGECRPACT